MSIRIQTGNNNLHVAASLGLATGAFTFAGWVKQKSNLGGYADFFGAGDTIGPTSAFAGVQADGAGNDVQGYTTGIQLGTALSLTVNTWYYVVVDRDGSHNVRCRVFDDSSSTTPLGTATGTDGTTDLSTLANFAIGVLFVGSPGDNVDAEFACVRAHIGVSWTNAQCRTESQKLTPQTGGGSIYGNWRLETDEANAGGINDTGGAGHHLSATGTVANGASRPTQLEAPILPVSDDFTGADSTDLATYSSAWLNVLNANCMSIKSNRYRYTSATTFQFSAYMWNLDSFSNDHYAQVSLFTAGAGTELYAGPSTRCSSGGGGNAYLCVVNTNAGNVTFSKDVGGTVTFLNNSNPGFTNGDIVRLEARGSTHTIYRNGVSKKVTTDTSLTTGGAGVCSTAQADTVTGTDGDNFQADNLGPEADDVFVVRPPRVQWVAQHRIPEPAPKLTGAPGVVDSVFRTTTLDTRIKRQKYEDVTVKLTGAPGVVDSVFRTTTLRIPVGQQIFDRAGPKLTGAPGVVDSVFRTVTLRYVVVRHWMDQSIPPVRGIAVVDAPPLTWQRLLSFALGRQKYEDVPTKLTAVPAVVDAAPASRTLPAQIVRQQFDSVAVLPALVPGGDDTRFVFLVPVRLARQAYDDAAVKLSAAPGVVDSPVVGVPRLVALTPRQLADSAALVPALLAGADASVATVLVRPRVVAQTYDTSSPKLTGAPGVVDSPVSVWRGAVRLLVAQLWESGAILPLRVPGSDERCAVMLARTPRTIPQQYDNVAVPVVLPGGDDRQVAFFAAPRRVRSTYRDEPPKLTGAPGIVDAPPLWWQRILRFVVGRQFFDDAILAQVAHAIRYDARLLAILALDARALAVTAESARTVALRAVDDRALPVPVVMGPTDARVVALGPENRRTVLIQEIP